VDHDRFDTLARALVGGASRRALLGFASVSGLAMLGLAALPGADDAAAKKGGKKRKRRRRRCKLSALPGRSCSADKTCCPSKKYVCGIPFGGAETDPKECCGDEGATCKFPSDCCEGLTCPTGGGQCVPVKEE
jgi:hypothetical protein